jgi:hypothetical protein
MRSQPSCLPCLRGTQPNLNGASVISSPFIGVELTSWKARTLRQVTAVFDPLQTQAAHHHCDATFSFGWATMIVSTSVKRSSDRGPQKTTGFRQTSRRIEYPARGPRRCLTGLRVVGPRAGVLRRIAEAGAEQPVEVRNIGKAGLQGDIANPSLIIMCPGQQRERRRARSRTPHASSCCSASYACRASS